MFATNIFALIPFRNSCEKSPSLNCLLRKGKKQNRLDMYLVTSLISYIDLSLLVFENGNKNLVV